MKIEYFNTSINTFKDIGSIRINAIGRDFDIIDRELPDGSHCIEIRKCNGELSNMEITVINGSTIILK